MFRSEQAEWQVAILFFELRTLYNFRRRLSQHMQETGENLLMITVAIYCWYLCEGFFAMFFRDQG